MVQKQTLATIRRAKGDPHIPFSVFKPSGFARFALFEKLNAGQTLSEAGRWNSRASGNVETICELGSSERCTHFRC